MFAPSCNIRKSSFEKMSGRHVSEEFKNTYKREKNLNSLKVVKLFCIL